MANKKIKVKLIRGNSKLPKSNNGNWYDCYSSKVVVSGKSGAVEKESGIVRFSPGDTVMVYLGFSADVGKGYEGHILPRSSTFKNTGLLLTNGMGIVDDTYNGDNDEWKAMFYATDYGAFKIGDRLVQIQVEKSTPVDIEQVEKLGNTNRGGYGSTGK